MSRYCKDCSEVRFVMCVNTSCVINIENDIVIMILKGKMFEGGVGPLIEYSIYYRL